ncbi:TMEM165/GDT1 family protein [Desulfonatronovibrio hydrogenovorans]|uniref:TMEM165/GDT1 family protein n=1 Tax=Desulfonatronovibrio hydrogenovorans TaxID=53245 RepID=UPI00048D764B|nr:TMEM165/GDT1 family protein [Desulfonatronovibrio hydrogenovorans]
MDIKLFFTTFGIIFLAELGDKTQMASVLMAAQSQKPWTVFIGASLALVSITLLAVIFANIICNYIPGEAIKKFAAIGFLVIGTLMLVDKI